MRTWLDYWNAPNKIYVNLRHQEAHYEALFEGLKTHLPARPGSVVLDWGCGDALAAPKVAERCDTLVLYEGAAATLDRLRTRFSGHPRIKIVDDAQLEGLASSSLDLIVVNSVIQYLSRQQFIDAMARFHWLLKGNGILLIGDVIDPRTSNYHHAAVLLNFALRHGFFRAALGGLLVTFFSSYRKLQRDPGLACYTTGDMLQLLKLNGFRGELLSKNIAVSQLRRSYRAIKADAPTM